MVLVPQSSRILNNLDTKLVITFTVSCTILYIQWADFSTYIPQIYDELTLFVTKYKVR
jgi:hypothetical protein